VPRQVADPATQAASCRLYPLLGWFAPLVV
jgi:hypothetical protein